MDSEALHYVAAGAVVVHGGCVLVLRRPKRNEVRLPNGLMVQLAGERKHAKTWAVVSYETANSPLFSYKSELGELADTPAHKGMTDIFSYKSGAGTNSLDFIQTELVFTKDGKLKHFLSIEGLNKAILTDILDTAESFTSVTDRSIKKVPILLK